MYYLFTPINPALKKTHEKTDRLLRSNKKDSKISLTQDISFKYQKKKKTDSLISIYSLKRQILESSN